MKRILLSLDIDGTLLNSKSKVPFWTKQYFKHFVKKGNIVLLNTGRPFTGSSEIYKSLGLYHLPISVNNGEAIVSLDKNNHLTIIEEHLIPKEVILSLFSNVKDYLENCFALDLDTHYFYKPSVPEFIRKFHKPNKILTGDLSKILPEKGVLTFTCHIHPAYKKEFLEIVEQYDMLQRIDFGHRDGIHSYHFSLKGYSKASAMKSIEKSMQIEHKYTFAYGDSSNDIDMIQYAEYGIAMCNCSEKLKSVAKYFTTHSHHHNGFLKDFKKRLRKIQ